MHQKVVKVVSHYTASLRKTHTNGRLSTPLIYTLTCQISFSMNIFKRTSQKSLLYRTGCLDVFLNFACKIKAHLSKTIRIFSVAPNGLGVEAKFRRRWFSCFQKAVHLCKMLIFSLQNYQNFLWAQTVMESIYISLTLLHTDTHCVSVNLLKKRANAICLHWKYKTI